MKIEISNHGKWQLSLTLKLAVLAFMGLLLLIPLELVKEVIMERQGNAEKVKTEISSQWASGQTVSGPVLNIPLRSIPTEKDEKSVMTIWHIMPEMIQINGKLNPEIRYRGIYQSVVYQSDISMSGEFASPDPSSPGNYDILWNEAYLTLGVTDNRGLKGDVVINAAGRDLHAEPGVRDRDIFSSGVSFSFPLEANGDQLKFKVNLSLSGSESFNMVPLGKITGSKIESDWSSPSFTGSFLPSSREVNDKGFSAMWEITHLNRNFPQNWIGNIYNPAESSFGIDLFLPVDHYQKSWRSARYGILFIALTFLVLIFLEITRKESVHVIHYFLVSLGLVLFFSLLNALSEHTGFNMAYLIASLATITLITLFTSSVFSYRRASMIVAAMLSLMYGFIFILLSLDDYAYLAGNIGLFILLAVVMRLAGKLKILGNNNGSGSSVNGEMPDQS